MILLQEAVTLNRTIMAVMSLMTLLMMVTKVGAIQHWSTGVLTRIQMPRSSVSSWTISMLGSYLNHDDLDQAGSAGSHAAGGGGGGAGRGKRGRRAGGSCRRATESCRGRRACLGGRWEEGGRCSHGGGSAYQWIEVLNHLRLCRTILL